MYLKLPKRVFNSPLVAFTNFEDGSFVNLIRLVKPYANGNYYAVYETTKSPFCSNGMFKTFERAKEKYDLIVKNGMLVSKAEKHGFKQEDGTFKTEDYNKSLTNVSL